MLNLIEKDGFFRFYDQDLLPELDSHAGLRGWDFGLRLLGRHGKMLFTDGVAVETEFAGCPWRKSWPVPEGWIERDFTRLEYALFQVCRTDAVFTGRHDDGRPLHVAHPQSAFHPWSSALNDDVLPYFSDGQLTASEIKALWARFPLLEGIRLRPLDQIYDLWITRDLALACWEQLGFRSLSRAAVVPKSKVCRIRSNSIGLSPIPLMDEDELRNNGIEDVIPDYCNETQLSFRELTVADPAKAAAVVDWFGFLPVGCRVSKAQSLSREGVSVSTEHLKDIVFGSVDSVEIDSWNNKVQVAMSPLVTLREGAEPVPCRKGRREGFVVNASMLPRFLRCADNRGERAKAETLKPFLIVDMGCANESFWLRSEYDKLPTAEEHRSATKARREELKVTLGVKRLPRNIDRYTDEELTRYKRVLDARKNGWEPVPLHNSIVKDLRFLADEYSDEFLVCPMTRRLLTKHRGIDGLVASGHLLGILERCPCSYIWLPLVRAAIGSDAARLEMLAADLRS